MDKGYYRSAFRIVRRSRWLSSLEWFYIAYVVLQMSL